MKHHFTAILCFLGFLAACTGNKTEGNLKGLESAAKGYTILKPFSDTLKVDTFKVVLKGDEPSNMVMSFSITTASGTKIYQKDFKATEMVKNYESTLDLKKESKQTQFMLEEYKLFLADENFLEPAVTDQEKPDVNTPDKEFFEELKLSGLNGFQYRLSNENKVYIAWSGKEKKVLPYYSCCKPGL